MSKNTDTMHDLANSFLLLIGMTTDLIQLIREEETLRRHHRAYLHVRDAILESSDKLAAYMSAALPRCCKDSRSAYTPVCKPIDNCPFAAADGEDEAAPVIIAKRDYDNLVEDILTLAELVAMVTEMRGSDLEAIRKLGKFIPSFVDLERSRTNVYRDARFEADEIINRLDDMVAPYEFFSN